MYSTSAVQVATPTVAPPHIGTHTATVQPNGSDRYHHATQVNRGIPVTNGNHFTKGLPSLDQGNVTDIFGKAKPIAIVGMSCRFPGGATDPGKFWDMLAEGRNGWSEENAGNFKMSSFYNPNKENVGTFNMKGLHFLSESSRTFDSQFFNISPIEAKAMDPQHRLLLELGYEAFESVFLSSWICTDLEKAGMSLEKIAGSEIGVYTAFSNSDYNGMLSRDPENHPLYQFTGCGGSMMANRISYFFDLKGPSMVVDTACSGSLVAFHLACQSIQSGECQTALVGSANLILDPGVMTGMSSLGFFSDEGRCFAFDSRGSGYGRGEGIGCVLIKSLDAALADGDPIRAVIRGTATNSDGGTTGLTVPSQVAQEALTRKAYNVAGLDPTHTSYVETHGTGTNVGDNNEIRAITSTFSSKTESTSSVYISSVKTNVGHLECVSGLAGVIKTALALEKGLIPPHLNYKTPRPEFSLDDWNLKIPLELQEWPENMIRRASINNYGYGGTNAHAIIDNSYQYLSERGLSTSQAQLPSNETSQDGNSTHHYNGVLNGNKRATHHVFVLSSNSKASLQESIRTLREFLVKYTKEVPNSFLEDLAYTLCLRRTHFNLRVSVTASSVSELIEGLENALPALKSSQCHRIGFVFNGQGAAWAGMGCELIQAYPVFKNSLQKAGQHFSSLGASWDLIEEISRWEESSRVLDADLSQPLCTALQIALVDLLGFWSLEPAAVTGHSSGEIAAAYSCGSLSFEDALTVAYFRGYHACRLSQKYPSMAGAMLAVGLSEAEAKSQISQVSTVDGKLTVACVNSASSVTISGDRSAVDELRKLLEAKNIFHRLLPVDIAYHSHHMLLLSKDYLGSISKIQPRNSDSQVSFWSSVTGDLSNGEDLEGTYWVRNFTSKVRFYQSFKKLCTSISKKPLSAVSKPDIDMILEIGPHSALKGPIRSTTTELLEQSRLGYASCLIKGSNSCKTMLDLVGLLFTRGFSTNFDLINFPNGTTKRRVLFDLPRYAWNHSTPFWHESRISTAYRHRKQPRHHLLGVPAMDNNILEPRWRNFIRVSERPWVRGHMVGSKLVYPAAGYIAMALEASRQLARETDGSKPISGYELRDISIGKALLIPDNADGVETVFSLRPYASNARGSSTTWNDFRVFSHVEKEGWSEHCRGLIGVKFHSEVEAVEGSREADQISQTFATAFADATTRCRKIVAKDEAYRDLTKLGLVYTGAFRCINSVAFGEDSTALGVVQIPDTKDIDPAKYELPHILHPATLDGFVQVLATLLTEHATDTFVPTFIESMFVSEDIKSEYGSELLVLANATMTTHRTCNGDIMVADPDNVSIPVVTISGLTCTALEANLSATTGNLDTICHKYRWNLDPDLSITDDLREYCTSGIHFERNDIMMQRFEACADGVIRDALRLVIDVALIADNHTLLYNWMKRYVDSGASFYQGPIHGESNSDLRRNLEPYGGLAKMLYRIGDNLPDIIKGEKDPLELMLQNKLLDDIYREESFYRCNLQLAKYIALLAHKKPDMKVLEIGAGTGASTAAIFDTLKSQQPANQPGGFQQYDFTDISVGFFERAQEEFKPWNHLVQFKKFDVEANPADQGFEEGTYDLIIASNVLHATKSLDNTLANVKRLLSPKGKLALVELTHESLTMGLIFGCFSGWWNGIDDGRVDSPILTVAQWSSALLRNGFTGVDLCLRDSNYGGDPNSLETISFMSVILSSVSDTTSAASQITASIGIDIIDASYKSDLSLTLSSLQKLIKTPDLHVINLKDAVPENKICIIFTEAKLTESPEELFKQFLKVLNNAAGIILVTTGATINCENTEASIFTGLTRVARSEHPDKKLITLDLDPGTRLSQERLAQLVHRIYSLHFSEATMGQPTEADYEYSERKGQVLLPRFVEENAATRHIDSLAGSASAEMLPFFEGSRRVQLEIQTPGLLDSIRWVDQESVGILGSDEIDFETRAVGINFRDVMICLGQLPGIPLNSGEYSGVITAVGANMKDKFKPGDRICAASNKVYGNRVRSIGLGAVKIPDDMTFETAATIPFIYVTVHFSFVTVGRLQKGESVLIHSAAGGVGQVAVMFAKHIGATVFVTVGNERKKKLIMDNFGIPESHIFSSRTTSFSLGIKRLTSGKGVDVILNSLSGDMFRETCKCLAPRGRFVEIGKKDILLNTRMDMARLDGNRTYSSLDLTSIFKDDPQEYQAALASCMSLLQDGSLTTVKPISTWHITDVELAFREIQTGKHSGKLVLTTDPDCTVKIEMVPARTASASFRQDASYLIAGGLGGLGRALCRWMVTLGAKNIIALSRSGLVSEEAQTLAKELEEAGVRFSVYTCNVGDQTTLKGVFDNAKEEMPPIRGLIQAAMDLKDATFENITYEDFQSSAYPKVQGSLNLQNLLPKEQLDFFILLSSCSGMIGNMGQGSYAAACTFQDGLARRSSLDGPKMISIDLAAVESAGFVAENPDIKIVGFRETTPLKLSEFFAVMNYAMTTRLTDADSRQLTVGHGMDTAGSPWDAKFSHLRGANSGRNKAGSSGASVDYKKKLGAAKSMEEAEQIVFETLVERLHRILGIVEEDIDETKSIAKHGGDSLVAVELRNWLSMNLGASIPMLDIVKEIPLREFALNVATASTFTNPTLLDSSILTADGNTDSVTASNGTPSPLDNGTAATSVGTNSPANAGIKKDEIPHEVKMIDGDRVTYEIKRHLATQKEIKAELAENLKM